MAQKRDAGGQMRWGDGSYIHSKGYVMVNVGKGHPLADSKGYCALHVLVWVSAGRERATLNKRQLLHHKDENKINNKLDNLVMLQHDEHTTHHNSISNYRRQQQSLEDDSYPNFERR